MKVKPAYKIITLILAALIVASFACGCFIKRPENEPTTPTEETQLTEETVPEPESPSETETETEEESTTKTNQWPTVPPEEYMSYETPVDRFLYSIADIDTMILVIGDQYTNNSAVLYYYEKIDGEWVCTFLDDAWCGSNGFSDSTYEGDRTTPVGLFELGVAFGNNPNPGTELEWIDVNEHMYWVDDNTSEYYNQLIDDREVPTGWNSGEHLIEYTLGYAYSINMEVNPPYETSAIFLHCHGGARSTAGCIGISDDGMIWILQHIKPDTRIAVVEYEEDLDNIYHLWEN